MTKRTRIKLKEQFQQGKMPSQDDFTDLIESMLNMLDEGFEKTPEHGLKLAQLRDGKLMSFYKDISSGNQLWSLGLAKSSSNLNIQDARHQSVLTLASQRDDKGVHHSAVGIKQENPQHELDVAGCVASFGRMGKVGEFAVPADSNWYDITDFMTGCQAFEVIAGVGAKDADGRYALTHAFALNAFDANGSIEYQQTYFGIKCNRIELRWQSAGDSKPFEFKLQMRVGCSYGSEVWIQYRITKLWYDTLMLGSENKPERAPQPQYDPKGKVKV
jgi:hypothetical protein